MHGITDNLSVVVNDFALSVCVTWQDKHWDQLLSLECVAEAGNGNNHCRLCEAEAERYPSMADLLANHVSHPFLQWITVDLAQASHLHLGGVAGSWKWAKLSPNSQPDETGTQSIQLRSTPP